MAWFLLSGSIILSGATLHGRSLPRGRELWLTALSGLLPLGVATGALIYTQTWLPPALTALYITTAPFWMVGLELLAGGERLRGGTLLGMAGGFLWLQFANAAWAAGAVLFRRRSTGVDDNGLLAGALLLIWPEPPVDCDLQRFGLLPRQTAYVAGLDLHVYESRGGRLSQLVAGRRDDQCADSCRPSSVNGACVTPRSAPGSSLRAHDSSAGRILSL